MYIKSFLFICILNIVLSCNKQKKQMSVNTKKVSSIENINISKIDIDKSKLVLNPNEGKWYYKDIPFNGYAVVHYNNGQLKERIGFFEGKKEGIAKKWFSDGLLRKEYYHHRNRIVGELRIWSPNPNSILVKESNYLNGVEHGVQKIWHVNGQLAKSRNLSMGKEEGLQQAWLENGKIYINYQAKEGRSFGLKRSTLCHSLKNEKVVL